MSTTFEIKVIPKASRNEVVEWKDQILKVKVQAPADRGRANDAVLTLLAQTLGCKKGQLSILSGEKSRQKRIQVNHWTSDELLNQLLSYAPKR